jgi:hypothetical protein
MKSDFYYCINNDFEVFKYSPVMNTDSKTDHALNIDRLYYISFGKSIKFFDIYTLNDNQTDKNCYHGWTHINNFRFFKTKAEFLAEWREKQINSILDEG